MNTLILLGGEKSSDELLVRQLAWADSVVAADSGVEPMLALGCEPDILTGDFDSVKTDISSLSCRVEKELRQDATDFEKALFYTEMATAIHILGGLGGRHDHLITNLLIAASIDCVIPVLFFSDCEVLHRITPQCPLTGRFTPSSTMSLLPFSRCEGVVASGLKWCLDGVVMGVGEQLGQSNIVAIEEIRISIELGVMYVAVQTDKSTSNH